MQRVKSTDEDEDSDQEDMVQPSFKVAEQEVNLLYGVKEMKEAVTFTLIQIMNRCLEILNNSTTVGVLISALQIPSVLSHVCTIGHNLLLSDRLAIHNNR